VRVKPNARLCERWVTRENLSRAGEQRLNQSSRNAQINKNSVAAPRLRNHRDCLPKARRLALGLPMAAAPQLDGQLTQSRLRSLYVESLTDRMAGIEKQDHDPGVEQQLQANRLVKEPRHGYRQKITERHTN